MLPHVDVEGASHVGPPTLVPLVGAEADLEGVHSLAVVLQLLVSILGLIKSIGLVFKANVEAREFRVKCDEVAAMH